MSFGKAVVFLVCLISSSDISDWNFDGLASPTYYETPYGSYTYRFNFRKVLPVDSSHSCALSNCVVEELTSSSSYCYCCGNISTETIDIWPDDSAINFTYHSNMSSTQTHGHFTLRCNESGLSYSAAYSGYDIYVNISAPQGCKGYGVDDKNSKGGGAKISFGGVFFIILLILVFLYFAIGIPVSYFVLHKTGVELFVPFFSYIMIFLHDIVGGVKFIFGKITGKGGSGAGGGGDSAYSKI